METELVHLYTSDKDFTGEEHFCLTHDGKKHFGKVYLSPKLIFYCEVAYEIQSDNYPIITHVILVDGK